MSYIVICKTEKKKLEIEQSGPEIPVYSTRRKALKAMKGMSIIFDYAIVPVGKLKFHSYPVSKQLAKLKENGFKLQKTGGLYRLYDAADLENGFKTVSKSRKKVIFKAYDFFRRNYPWAVE